jgi:hypothetical protein
MYSDWCRFWCRLAHPTQGVDCIRGWRTCAAGRASEVFYLGCLKVLHPVGMLDPVLERLTRASTVEDEGIMEHSREAFQGINHDFVHWDMPGFPCLDS